MLPSIRLIILVLVAAAMFLASVVAPPCAAIAVVYLVILAVYAGVDVLLLPKRNQIVVERTVPTRISINNPTLVKLTIRNTSQRKLQVRLAEQLPKDMEVSQGEWSFTLAPGATVEQAYRLTVRRRGEHSLNPLDVRLLPARGLFHRQFQAGPQAELEVYPSLVDLRRHRLLVRRGLTQEAGLMRLRQMGRGSDFESLRQYRRGDPMNHIDWKATARRNSLIVRNYQPERQQSVLVAIDAGRATAGEFDGVSRLDYLVNAALMLGYVTLSQGDWFSLVAFSDEIESYLPPVRRVQNIDRVANALYSLKPKLVESDYGAACRFLDLKNRKRSLICLMTDVISRYANDEVLAYMGRFARHHLPLAVTLVDPAVAAVVDEPLAECGDVFSKAAAVDVMAARREALMTMRRYGVSVLDVAPEDLSPELINRYLKIKATRRL